MQSPYVNEDTARLIAAVDEALSGNSHDTAQLGDARQRLLALAEAARQTSNVELAASAELLANVVEIAMCTSELTAGAARSEDDAEATETGPTQPLDFVRAGLEVLRSALEDEAAASEDLARIQREARDRWGDYLNLLRAESIEEGSFSQWDFELDFGGQAADEPAPEDIQKILSSLAEIPVPEPDPEPVPTTAQQPFSPATHAGELPTPPPPATITIEDEVLAAYLDDATRCLASLEEAVLTIETDPAATAAQSQICRELHTLKGASASVGLTALAEYLHAIEDYVQGIYDRGESAQIDPLLESLDAVRSQIGPLSSRSVGAAADTSRSNPMSFSPSFDTGGEAGEDTLRVKTSQLDRLMDVLAGLVILRNKRDTRVSQLQTVHDELLRCVAKLRVLSDSSAPRIDSFARRSASLESEPDGPGRRFEFTQSPLEEIASDLSELARCLRDAYQPMTEENLAVSRFVRDFRQELMELRRVPVSGLFRRLRRAARDAARVETKDVRLELIGEQTGLEASLQERLYEPLLHIVRNAVSHGIESPEQRAAAGKPRQGVVTLDACCGPNALILEVRDDGRGLDYDAIRRKGVELGLINTGRHVTREELAQLIFHAGFSTRQSASAVSGRGVGMDVVASNLERLRASIDIDSEPGRGSTIRLTIPLRSVIEHTMVFRVDGRLFALPMESIQSSNNVDVEAALSGQLGADAPRVVWLRELLGSRLARPKHEQVLVVGHGRRESRFEQRLALLVDEVVGPEDVVVRTIPPLLKPHRLFNGVTLSGAGDIMLLLDSHQLLEMGFRATNRLPAEAGDTTVRDAVPESDMVPSVLVVDDSLSVRRTLAQTLHHWNCRVFQASDGLEALDLLRSRQFTLLLTDIEMPRLGGLELLSEINNGRHRRPEQIVILSSRNDAATRRRATELGAGAYLNKPVSKKSLELLLSEFGFRQHN